MFRLKRGYWVIESRLHHCLDVTMQEDLSRVRNPNAACILGTIRRIVLSLSNAALDARARSNPKPKAIPRPIANVSSPQAKDANASLRYSFRNTLTSGPSEIEKTRPKPDSISHLTRVSRSHQYSHDLRESLAFATAA
jgi:hypothetical protein